MSENILQLSKGVDGIFIKNTQFNTTLISYNFYLPLKKDTVAAYGLLPFILTSCGKQYPDFSQLNYKLAKLYGAKLDASAEKYGDYQLLKMSISVINDRFSLDGEPLVMNASEMLLGLIFEPNVENNAFLPEDLNREKRKAIEHIKGQLNDKRIYAKTRLIEEMYKGTPYGIPKCGTVEDVEAITCESLYSAWQQMLNEAYVRVHVVGAAVPNGLFEAVKEKFDLLYRQNVTDCKVSSPTPVADSVITVTDKMDVTQGKLCLGFSSSLYGNDDVALPLMVMADIFGGGPYSRLFSNVREKLSLCYYCRASAVLHKGLLMVESGVEKENIQKAQVEILNQLDIVKNGEFTDFEFESSIKSIIDTFNSYNDSQTSLDMWYTLKANNQNLYSPTEVAEKISAITREDVINAAKGIKLNTVYQLLPKE